MRIEAYDNDATLIGDGTTQDWERVQAAATLMMDALPLYVVEDWDHEYIALGCTDPISATDLSEAYEDAYIELALRDRRITP